MLVKEGVFFDLYGTLIIPKNNKKAWKNWLTTFYKLMGKFGLRMKKIEFTNACNGFFAKAEIKNNNNNLSVYENKINRFAIDLNLKLKFVEIREIQQKTIKAWHKYIEIDPETIPLLEVLKNKKSLALITNFDHPPHVYSILSKYRLTKYFEFIAISGEIGFEKPNPKIFHVTLEKIGLKPADVVFIGDSIEDVEGANNAGVKPILIQHQSSKKKIVENDYYSNTIAKNLNTQNSQINPWKVISNLKDLYKLLNL